MLTDHAYITCVIGDLCLCRFCVVDRKWDCQQICFLSGDLLKGRKKKKSVDRNCAFLIGDVLTKKICVVYLTEIVRV